MKRYIAVLCALVLPETALAQAPISMHANYDAYAAGIHVAQVETGFSFERRTYQMTLDFRTTGLVGFLFRGHQSDVVEGTWRGNQAIPSRFVGQGVWRGTDRVAEIEYKQGKPDVRKLIPPNAEEREPVPEALQANTIDTLSALAGLIRSVGNTGRCEATARTFDGRRATEIAAKTIGNEELEPANGSSFRGKALRCDFSGRMLAGFKFNEDPAKAGKPMKGSAWLAPVVAGGPPLPVRMTFENRWFGEITMYLASVAPGPRAAAAK